MKILNLSAHTLIEEKGLNNAIKVIASYKKNGEKLIVTVATNSLIKSTLFTLLTKAKANLDFQKELDIFYASQFNLLGDDYFIEEKKKINAILEGTKILQDYSISLRNNLWHIGNKISAKIIYLLLKRKGVQVKLEYAQRFFEAQYKNNEPTIDRNKSKEKTLVYFKEFLVNSVLITNGGFVHNNNKVIYFGKKGSSLTAFALAEYLNADEIIHFTNEPGILNVNPKFVPNPIKLTSLSVNNMKIWSNTNLSPFHKYAFSVLRTKNIPIQIKSISSPSRKGTSIKNDTTRAIYFVDDKKTRITIHFKGNQNFYSYFNEIITLFRKISKDDLQCKIDSKTNKVSFFIDTNLLLVFKNEIEKMKSKSIEIEIDNGLACIGIIGGNQEMLLKKIYKLQAKKMEKGFLSLEKSDNFISLIIKNDHSKPVLNYLHK